MFVNDNHYHGLHARQTSFLWIFFLRGHLKRLVYTVGLTDEGTWFKSIVLAGPADKTPTDWCPENLQDLELVHFSEYVWTLFLVLEQGVRPKVKVFLNHPLCTFAVISILRSIN